MSVHLHPHSLLLPIVGYHVTSHVKPRAMQSALCSAHLMDPHLCRYPSDPSSSLSFPLSLWSLQPYIEFSRLY